MVKETNPEKAEKKDSKNEPIFTVHKDTVVPGRPIHKPPENDKTDDTEEKTSDSEEEINKVLDAKKKIEEENEEMFREDMRKIRQNEIDRMVINFEKKKKAIGRSRKYYLGDWY